VVLFFDSKFFDIFPKTFFHAQIRKQTNLCGKSDEINMFMEKSKTKFSQTKSPEGSRRLQI
jgi:hypothetical protein